MPAFAHEPNVIVAEWGRPRQSPLEPHCLLPPRSPPIATLIHLLTRSWRARPPSLVPGVHGRPRHCNWTLFMFTALQGQPDAGHVLHGLQPDCRLSCNETALMHCSSKPTRFAWAAAAAPHVGGAAPRVGTATTNAVPGGGSRRTVLLRVPRGGHAGGARPDMDAGTRGGHDQTWMRYSSSGSASGQWSEPVAVDFGTACNNAPDPLDTKNFKRRDLLRSAAWCCVQESSAPPSQNPRRDGDSLHVCAALARRHKVHLLRFQCVPTARARHRGSKGYPQKGTVSFEL